jgi:glucokinase
MAATRKRKLPVIALDIGGTKLITALVSPKGEMLAREYSLTLADEGPEAVIRRISSAIDHLLAVQAITLGQVEALSIAIAGPIDMDGGIVSDSPNLPGWRNIPLCNIIKDRFGIGTYLINDAKAAVLGEHCFGAGRGVNNLIYITVSTGIGGGIITNGKLYFGQSGGAGEVGHMTIDTDGPTCTCGNIGCWETLASGKALAREAITRLDTGEKSSLRDMVAGRIENITAKEVSLAAQDGDSLAQSIIARTAYYLGVGLVNLVNIFNPEMIIIGGGLSKMGNLLFEPARQVVRNRAFPLLAQAVRIVPAELGDDAGVFGAAVFVFQKGIV